MIFLPYNGTIIGFWKNIDPCFCVLFKVALSSDLFLDLHKFLVAERKKFWRNFIWHQLKRDKATFNNVLESRLLEPSS